MIFFIKFCLTEERFTSSVVVGGRHLKVHSVPGTNWQVNPGLYPQSRHKLVQFSGVGVVVIGGGRHLKVHSVPGTNWQVNPGLYPQSRHKLVQFPGGGAGVVVGGLGVVVGGSGGFTHSLEFLEIFNFKCILTLWQVYIQEIASL